MTEAGPKKAALVLTGLALATPLTLNLLIHMLAPLHGDSFLSFVVRSDAGGLLGVGGPLAGLFLSLAAAVMVLSRTCYSASNRFGYLALAAFVGLGFVSAAFSEIPHDALVSWTLVSAAALAYFLGSLLVSPMVLEQLKLPMVATAGLVALLSLLSYNPAAERPVMESAFQTNSLGAYLLLLLPTVWLVLLEPATGASSSWARHLLVLPVLSSILVCLMMTFSRGAQLVFLIQMVLLFAFLPGRPGWAELGLGTLVLMGGLLCILNKLALGVPLLLLSLLGMLRRFVWVTWVVVCLVVALILSGAIYQVVDPEGQAFEHANTRIQRLAKRDNSSTTRLRLWKTAAHMTAQHPALGIGSGNYRHYHPRYQRDFSVFSSSPHSWLLTLSAEQGLPATLVIVAFLLWNMKAGWNDLETHETRQPYLAVAVGTLSFLLFDFLDVQLRYHLVLATAAFLAGALRADPNSASEHRARPILAPIFLVASALYVWILAGRFLYFKATQAEGDTVARAQACLRVDPWEDDGYHVWAGKEPQIEVAVKTILRAIELAPVKASHHHLLGNLLLKMDRIPESEAAFRQALNLDPFNRPLIYYDLAQNLAFQGRGEEARQVLERAIPLYPAEDLSRLHTIRQSKFTRDLALLESRLGEILYEQGHILEAEPHFRKSLLIEPSLEGHLGLGALLSQTQRYQEAVPHLEEVLRRDPIHGIALHYLVECYSALGQPEKAEAMRRRLSQP